MCTYIAIRIKPINYGLESENWEGRLQVWREDIHDAFLLFRNWLCLVCGCKRLGGEWKNKGREFGNKVSKTLYLKFTCRGFESLTVSKIPLSIIDHLKRKVVKGKERKKKSSELGTKK